MAGRVASKHTFPSMDRGIDKILHIESEEKVDTPVRGELSPPQTPIRSMLDQLYAQQTLEQYVAEMLAPLINEPEVLIPGRFDRALRNAMESLLEAAEDDTRVARILQRAAHLMGDQVSLRELVQMYRQALLKG